MGEVLAMTHDDSIPGAGEGRPYAGGALHPTVHYVAGS